MEDVNELGDTLTHSFHQPLGVTFWLYPLLKFGICEDLRTRFRNPNPNYACLVAVKSINTLEKKDTKIVGTVEVSLRHNYWYWPQKYVYLSNLAVINASRRQGIASKLLQKCEQIAYNWGYENIYLHVLENNHQATKLYLGNGYKINHIDSDLSTWITRSPRRLFLQKSL